MPTTARARDAARSRPCAQPHRPRPKGRTTRRRATCGRPPARRSAPSTDSPAVPPCYQHAALASAPSRRRLGCAGTPLPSSHRIRNPTTVKNSAISGDILPSGALKGAQRVERGSKRVETASLCLIYNGNDTLYVIVSLNILSDDKISLEIAGFFTIEGRGPRSKSNQGPKSKRRIRHHAGFSTTPHSPPRRILHCAAFATAPDSPPRRIRRRAAFTATPHSPRTGTRHGVAR